MCRQRPPVNLIDYSESGVKSASVLKEAALTIKLIFAFTCQIITNPGYEWHQAVFRFSVQIAERCSCGYRALVQVSLWIRTFHVARWTVGEERQAVTDLLRGHSSVQGAVKGGRSRGNTSIPVTDDVVD